MCRSPRLNSPWAVVLIVAVAYLGFVLLRLSLARWDPSAFVLASEIRCDPALVPRNLHVIQGGTGYDGEFYYRLALNPFTSVRTDFGISLDHPAYRHQRILYPLVVWLLSGGRPGPVPVVMILVNYLALCAMGWVAGTYARSMNRHALWGLVLVLYPGFLLTLARDLTEILEVSLLLAGLLSLRLRKPVPATVLLTLAVLSKESALVVVAGALLFWVWNAWKGKPGGALKWYVFAVPAGVFCTWQMLLFWNWGRLAVHPAKPRLALPFSGFADLFSRAMGAGNAWEVLQLVELYLLLAFLLAVLFVFRSSTATTHEKLSWLLYLLLVCPLAAHVWEEDWGFFRILSEFYVLGWVILLGKRWWPTQPLAAAWGALWTFLFVTRAA